MASGEKIIWMSAVELAKTIREGELSPVEVVDTFFDRINKINPELNAFVTLMEDSARKEAEKAEKAVKKGKKLGPLHGVPIAVKDNIDVKGVRLTYASKMYENNIAKVDMIHVERLRKAGVIILGKTNLPEFGLIPITDNPVFGPSRNPWDRSKTTGGSSGGSAAAIASGMAPIALGNDGGGSIRVPSSLCGVFGLKPHLGRIPRWPTLPGWETMAVEGPLTRAVADAALMMDIMSGPDNRDYLSLPPPTVSYYKKLEEEAKGKKFAYSPDLGYAVVDPEIIDVTRNAAFAFADLGYEVEEVELDFPNMENDLVNQVVAETVAANEEHLEEWKKVAWPEYLNFLWLADHIKATDYAKTQYRRKELWDKVREVFENYDFLLTPATAIPAFGIDLGMGPTEIDGKAVASTTWIAFTYPFNFTHQPASSVPCGFTKDNLPVGLQILGNRFDELGVLQASRAFEKALPWRDKRPPI